MQIPRFVGQVVKECIGGNIITDDADALWDRAWSEAGIDRREEFFCYFSGHHVGHAITVGKFERHGEQRDISAA